MTTNEKAEKVKARLAKARITKELNVKNWESQVVKIDEHWEIRRWDDLNWDIYKDGKDQKSYHRNLLSALTALPAKMLDSVARGSLNDVLRSHRGIMDKLENAFHG